MSLETLGSYFQSGGRDYLQRIYVAHQLQAQLLEKFQLNVRIVIKNKTVTAVCLSQNQAQAVIINAAKIYPILGKLGLQGYKLKTKVRAS